MNSLQRPGLKNKAAYGHVDLPLVLVLIVLGAFGLMMVFSASWDFSQAVYKSPSYIFFKQILFMAAGIAVAYVLSRIDYHIFKDRKVLLTIMGVTVFLLVSVLIVREVRLGAVRTLFQGSVQPSELAKVVTVVYLAVWLCTKRESLHDINLGLIPLALILGFIGGLIYLQPDLSATGTIFLLGGLLFFLAGGDLRQIVFLIIIALATAWIVVQFSPTGRERLAAYMSGLEDPMQSSYHVRRSLEAIVNGGWFGAGIGKARTKLTGLPVPPTDSIFAVVAEELGLFGAMGVVILFGLFVWRGLRISYKAPDMLGTLLAAGLTIWIGLEALMNMSVIVGLFPFAGNALPFVSAGGSNLIASLAAVGILMNIARQGNGKPQTQTQTHTNDEERRSFSATADLRRRNGRRGLSRTGRS
jgi:cell division protein FtsW